MKLNTDKSQSSVCKEDVLIHIFKDVANYNSDEEARAKDSWLGKQSVRLPNNDGTKERSEQKSSAQKKSKKISNAPATESKSELEIWSTTYPSEEGLPVAPKRSRRKRKQNRFSQDCALRLIQNVGTFMTSSDSLKPMDIKKYKNPEVLCDECRWLVKATQSLEHLASSEDDDVEKKNVQVQDISYENTLQSVYVHNTTEKQVMTMLDKVQSDVLECCILLITQKLHRKVRGDSRATGRDRSMSLYGGEEVGFSQSTTKMSQDLGLLVSRYLQLG